MTGRASWAPDIGNIAQEGERIQLQVDLGVRRGQPRPLDEREQKGRQRQSKWDRSVLKAGKQGS
jgi:hypothetical protein